MRTVSRGGPYFRLYKPGWSDPLDSSFARLLGGRWTPPGEFGALYLNATISVAAANARHQHARRAIQLFDLRPEKRPSLLDVVVPTSRVTDVVSLEGIAGLGLPGSYPLGVGRAQCWPIARGAYADTTIAGIACRSNAECTPTHCVGEELAWFDRSPLPRERRRRDFAHWYPGPQP